MSKFQVEEATREQAMLRLALSGPGGAGKTKTALKVARALVGPSGVVMLADTEFASASKYAPAKGAAADNEETFSFKRIPISGRYDPREIPALLECAVEGKADILIIDSMTHFWNGVGGFLELVDEEMKRQKSKGNKPDSFTAWKEIDPVYKRMIQAILSAPLHIICTLRAKTEYEKVAADGGSKGRVTKIGMAPEMRDHFQYEMDIEGMLDMEHNLVIGKTRCSALDGRVFNRPGADVAKILRTWLDTGDAVVKPAARPTKPPSTTRTVGNNEHGEHSEASSPARTASPTASTTTQSKTETSKQSPSGTSPATPTDEQKRTLKLSLASLGITSGQAAYITAANDGVMPESAEDFMRVNAELARRVAAKHTGKTSDPSKAPSTTTRNANGASNTSANGNATGDGSKTDAASDDPPQDDPRGDDDEQREAAE